MPLSPILWDIFEMKVLRQREGSGLCSPSGQTWITIRAVAYDGQIIGNRLRSHPELGHDAGFIAHNLAPAIALNHSPTDDTLRQILVGRANDYLAHPLVLGCVKGGGGQRVVSFVVDHRPYQHTHGLQSLFQNGKL